MGIAWLALIVCIAGALLYGLTNGKPSELGLRMFWVGLLVVLWHTGTAVVRIG